MNLHLAKTYILNRLEIELPTTFYYHNLMHTVMVERRASEIANLEGITDKYSLELLSTAALYHDSGFLLSYENHEEKSCEIVEMILPQFEYRGAEIAEIQQLIRATKIPQAPQSKLAKILCDADLDYLGGEQYYRIVKGLYLELLHFGKISVQDNWTQNQIDFLQKHSYFTQTNKNTRSSEKQLRLEELKSKI